MLPARYYVNPDFYKNAPLFSRDANAQVLNDYARYFLANDKNGIDYSLILMADRLEFQIDSLSQEQLQSHINNVTNEFSRNELSSN